MALKHKGSVLGIGNALVDIIIRVQDDDILRRISLPKGSMTMIDSERKNSILKEVIQYPREFTSGGSVANTIYGLSSLGIQTGYIGKIGSDEYGKIFFADVIRASIRPHLLSGNSPTGTAITLVTPDGERTFGTYLGAAVEMQAGELDPAVFKPYDWLMAEGYLIYNRDLIIRSLQIAKSQGLKVAMDMASYNLVEDYREFIISLLKDYVDLVFANEVEAHALTGMQDPEKALAQLGGLCHTAVVKIGKEGSWITSGGETVKVEGKPANCIDTTGAGDLYAAGFLYGQLNGRSLARSGEVGSLLGAHAVEVVGAKIPEARWKEIREWVS